MNTRAFDAFEIRMDLGPTSNHTVYARSAGESPYMLAGDGPERAEILRALLAALARYPDVSSITCEVEENGKRLVGVVPPPEP